MTKRLATYLWRHHLALLALFVVLGGTSDAAVNALPKNSVGSKQVINGSLQTLDLSKKARRALKGNRGPRGFTGAQGAKGATGAQGAQGNPGAPGAPGTAVAWAYVKSGGTVAADQSKDITDAMIARPVTGNYCFSGLGFTPKNIMASGDNIGQVYDTLATGSIPSTGQLFATCSGAQARVTTYGIAAAALANRDFYVWFED